MLLNEYQAAARKTAIYKDKMYPFLGLAEEIGEVMGKLAKMARGDKGVTDDQVVKELGDVLWMLANCAFECGATLEQVGLANLEKLADRQRRNKLQGEGDTR